MCFKLFELLHVAVKIWFFKDLLGVSMLIHHVDAIRSLDSLPMQDARSERHEPDVKPLDTTRGNFLFAELFSSPKKWPCPGFPFFIGQSFLSPGLNNMGFSLIPVMEPRFIHGLQEDGLRLALLLRLSPVLPIPFDSYWCGVSNFRFGWMKLQLGNPSRKWSLSSWIF